MIAAQRCEELDRACRRHWQGGGDILLASLTVPHGRADDLAVLVDAVVKSWSEVGSQRRYVDARKRCGYVGAVRALEVTRGTNGWHPHIHALLLFDRRLDPCEIEEIEAILRELWQRAVVRRGLRRPSDDRGIDLRRGYGAVADYLGKWGAAAELALAPLKRGKRGSLTPWALLDAASRGDDDAADLWREYAEVFAGRNQLVWSPGLKARLGIDADTDTRIVERDERGPAELLAVVRRDGSLSDWMAVCLTGRRAAVLDAAERAGHDGVDRVIEAAFAELGCARNPSLGAAVAACARWRRRATTHGGGASP